MNPSLLKPTVCPLCGGKVILSKTTEVYGKNFGSGYCYVCTLCHSAVQTHKSRPDEAMGTIADQKTKNMRTRCHNVFDNLWRNGNERRKKYNELAKILNIPETDCHFGYMNYETLVKAHNVLKQWWREKYDK